MTNIMLQLTRKVEYALAIVSYMRSIGEDDLHSARIISMHTSIPFDMVTKCLQRMSKQGLCQAVQGKNGGYRLLINFAELSLGSFIERVGDPVSLVECLDGTTSCAQSAGCCLVGPMRRLNDRFHELLSGMTLAEFLDGEPAVENAAPEPEPAADRA